MGAKEYYRSNRSVDTNNWTLEMAMNFADEYNSFKKSDKIDEVRNYIAGRIKYLSGGDDMKSLSESITDSYIVNEMKKIMEIIGDE
jgi:hypothetical protein